MGRIVHFEINADDPERAGKFYQDVFGWQVNKWEGPVDYWMAVTGREDEPGINGGIMRRMEPDAGIWNTVEVDDIDAYLARVEAAGGSVHAPKQAIPGVGYQAYCKDSEGNVFGLHQTDTSAG